MITETGRVVAVEPGCLWVETIRQSTCNSCSAQKGCGHGLMNKMSAGRPHHVRALLADGHTQQYRLNDEVEIAVPEQLVVTGALLVYILPLLTLLAGALLVSSFGASDGLTAFGAAAGLFVGMGVVKIHAYYTRDDTRIQPLVVGLKSAALHRQDSPETLVLK